MPLRFSVKHAEIVSLIITIIVVCLLGFYLPMIIEPFNDACFSNATILDNPPLIKALQKAQQIGVHMTIHGYRHEDFTTLTPEKAKEAVEKGIKVFNEAGLFPVAFTIPYGNFDLLLKSTKEAILSTGLPAQLPVKLSTQYSYGDGWRDMKSFKDPRYESGLQRIMLEQPGHILLHAQEWNIYLRTLMREYLTKTNRTDVVIRIDDIEVNTPIQNVLEMADLTLYDSVRYVAFAVIPAGTWRGGDPELLGVKVDYIMRGYWIFFLSASFFPFTFFVTWRAASKIVSENQKLEDPEGKLWKSVSVIVPAFNEEENISKCIESILSQNYPGKIEAIIVNDGSTDRTAEIASKYPVKLIDLKKNSGKSNALNLGFKESKSDILVFSDSDSSMDKDAVRLLVEYLDEHPRTGAVAGNVYIEKSKMNTLTIFQMIEYKIEQEINRHLQSLEQRILVCPGPLFAVRREVLKVVLFSDRTVVEDTDFTIEALRRFVPISWEPRAKVYTKAPRTLKSWLNQRKRWWYGNLQVWRIHKKWAKWNPWMLLNYISFATSTISLALLLLLPYLFSTYANPILMLQRGIFYTITPIILFFLMLTPLFFKDKLLILFLIPYIIIYSTLKCVIVSDIYIRYLTRLGVKVRFGSRVRRVR